MYAMLALYILVACGAEETKEAAFPPPLEVFDGGLYIGDEIDDIATYEKETDIFYLPEEIEAQATDIDVADESEYVEAEVDMPEFRYVNVPILMYHTSSEYNPGALAELYVRPSEFERQMLHLIDRGFTFVTFDDWHYLYRIERPVMVTFDDGYLANYTEIFPILQRHNITIVLFLTLSSLREYGLTEQMVRTMSESGLVVVESHTMTHADLAVISGNESRLRYELGESRRLIEELTGRRPVALAYPAGSFNEIVLEWTAYYYDFGVRHMLGMHNTEFCIFEIRRIRISRSTGFNAFVGLVG